MEGSGKKGDVTRSGSERGEERMRELVNGRKRCEVDGLGSRVLDETERYVKLERDGVKVRRMLSAEEVRR